MFGVVVARMSYRNVIVRKSFLIACFFAILAVALAGWAGWAVSALFGAALIGFVFGGFLRMWDIVRKKDADQR